MNLQKECCFILVDAGFIIRFVPYGRKKRDTYYRIIDEYTLFYLKWIEPMRDTLLSKDAPKGYWQQMQQSSAWSSWSGLAFEAICYKHIHQIARALELSPTALPYTWRHQPSKGSKDKGAQIDLLFDRQDDAITLCEIKYTQSPFIFDKATMENLNNEMAIFDAKTNNQKQWFVALISASGVRNNAYIDTYLDKTITLNALFK